MKNDLIQMLVDLLNGLEITFVMMITTMKNVDGMVETAVETMWSHFIALLVNVWIQMEEVMEQVNLQMIHVNIHIGKVITIVMMATTMKVNKSLHFHLLVIGHKKAT